MKFGCLKLHISGIILGKEPPVHLLAVVGAATMCRLNLGFSFIVISPWDMRTFMKVSFTATTFIAQIIIKMAWPFNFRSFRRTPFL
jgi:hypothetical protein